MHPMSIPTKKVVTNLANCARGVNGVNAVC